MSVSLDTHCPASKLPACIPVFGFGQGNRAFWENGLVEFRLDSVQGTETDGNGHICKGRLD